MLVLTRRFGEEIIIGDDIRVVVVRVQGDRVRIGIDAPRNVSVVRSELIEGASDASSSAAQQIGGAAPNPETAPDPAPLAP